MCYSKEVSQRSFIINMISSYILYTYSNNIENKLFAFIFAFIGLMQLYDWIFWENQDITNKSQADINFVTTKLAMIANNLQPIVLALLIYYFKGKIGKISTYMLVIYVIFMMIYSIKTFNKITYTLTEKVDVRRLVKDEEKASLFWEWNSNEEGGNVFVYSIFILTITMLAYENLSYPINIILSFISVFTFVLSWYIFKGHSVGRFWCNFVAFIPLFILFINT